MFPARRIAITSLAALIGLAGSSLPDLGMAGSRQPEANASGPGYADFGQISMRLESAARRGQAEGIHATSGPRRCGEIAAAAPADSPRLGFAGSAFDSTAPPPGSALVRIEDVDGITLLPATIRGTDGRDTSGTLVLDTGAGAIALDVAVAQALGVSDSDSIAAPAEIAPRQLSALRIGGFEVGPLSPLIVDMRPVWSAIDLKPLGLLGEAPIARGAMVLDRDDGILVIVPPADSSALDSNRVAASRRWIGRLIAPGSMPIPIRVGADGKVLVTARLRPPGAANTTDEIADSLVLVVDTGSTKCVLFEDAAGMTVHGVARWPSMRGLSAPTLFGPTSVRVARLRELAVVGGSGQVSRPGVDVILTAGALSAALERVVGEPVHGILGDSFLRHFRMAIDFRNHMLWLGPRTRSGDERKFEYCQPGLEIERIGRSARVSGVVEGSPAERAGITAGDQVVAVGRLSALHASILELARALEGPPGSKVRIRLRHRARERRLSLVRRWLLPGA